MSKDHFYFSRNDKIVALSDVSMFTDADDVALGVGDGTTGNGVLTADIADLGHNVDLQLHGAWTPYKRTAV